MAIYHCTVKTHSRRNESTNHAVRSAAYRAGAKLIDANSGNIYNYTRKREVRYSEIRLPTKAPARFKNRSELWSEVEKSEKRIDAQLFREIEVALPKELSRIQMIELLRVYLDEYAIKYGMIADFSIHDDENGNPHAHIMLTMRELDGDGFGKKNRDWNDKKLLEGWRKGWAKCANKALKEAGFDIRIDSRSYAEQGLDIEPTRHEGRTNISKNNSHKIETRRNNNRDISERNNIRSEIKSNKIELAGIEAEITKLKAPEQSALTVVRRKMLTSLKPVSVALDISDSEPIPNIIKPSNHPQPVNKLTNINRRILQSVKPLQESTCRAMVCYEAPELRKALYGIDDNLTFNLPKNHREAQACYSLRALFGKDADREFKERINAMKMVGMNYSWQAFYEELQEGVNSPYGANVAWWRAFARMTINQHSSTMQAVRDYVPDKYKSNFDDVIARELKKSNVLPPQPSSAIWVVNKPVEPEVPKIDEQKPTVEVQPVSKPQEPVVTESYDIPPPQQVEEAAPVKPFNPYPDPYRIPTPKPPNPWGSGSGFNPW